MNPWIKFPNDLGNSAGWRWVINCSYNYSRIFDVCMLKYYLLGWIAIVDLLPLCLFFPHCFGVHFNNCIGDAWQPCGSSYISTINSESNYNEVVLLTLDLCFWNRMKTRHQPFWQRQPQDNIGCSWCQWYNEWCRCHAKYGESQKHLINVSGK